jgi:hypothetical protein
MRVMTLPLFFLQSSDEPNPAYEEFEQKKKELLDKL